MTKIINGKNAPMGRLAVFAAKEALKGEEVVVLNCNDVIITGDKNKVKEDLEEKRRKVGSGQQGPKYPRTAERIVKRAIRGMLPNHRKGRGKDAFRRIKCYTGVPEEYQGQEKEDFKEKGRIKFVRVKEVAKK